MGTNVGGTDGTVWGRGKALCALPITSSFLQKCLRIEERGDLAHLIWVPQLSLVAVCQALYNSIQLLVLTAPLGDSTIIGSILQMRKLRRGEVK